MGTEGTERRQHAVREIMTQNVIRVGPDTSVFEIARLMYAHKISGIPVIGAVDEVLGVITELDMVVRNTRFKLPAFFTLLSATIYLETPSQVQTRLKHILGVTAKEIMSAPAVTIEADATIEQLAEMMVNRHVNPVPVLNKGKLAGIVSRSDIVYLMARQWEEPEESTAHPGAVP